MEKKKRKQINFRLSEDEWNYLMLKLKRKNLPLSLSWYAKNQTLYGSKIEITNLSPGEIKIITTSLAHIGNNLNQLTKLCHQNRLPDFPLEKFLFEIGEIKKLLFLILKLREARK